MGAADQRIHLLQVVVMMMMVVVVVVVIVVMVVVTVMVIVVVVMVVTPVFTLSAGFSTVLYSQPNSHPYFSFLT